MDENGRINVLIAHYLPHIVSGAERSVADLVKAMDSRFRVTMLVPGEGPLAEFYRDLGINVWAYEVSGPRRLLPLRHEWQSFLFAQKLRNRNYDVLIANTFPASSRIRTAAQIARLPLGIYVREIIPDNLLHREILAQADQVMVISKDLQNHVSRMTDASKVALTYNYIDPKPIVERGEAHRRVGRRLLPFPRPNPVIGLIGRVTPWKQQDLFVKAVPRILAKVPEARFAIIGGAQGVDQGYEQEVRALVRKLGVEEQVAFMGNRKDALEITTELAISALTSTREPLGRVILEAHLLGIPVVVPNNAGPAEIVQPKETGLMFDPLAEDAPEQFAFQVVRLLRDPELRDCLVRQAKESVYNTFAGHKHVEIQENLIESLARKQ